VSAWYTDAMQQEELNLVLRLQANWMAGHSDIGPADLSNVDLRRLDMRGVTLYGANLRGANLDGVDLSCADLRHADLRGAQLSGADLSDADLSCADLRGADLQRSRLGGAKLHGAEGIEWWHAIVKADLFMVLSTAPHEAPAVLAALEAGEVDGEVYDGPCSCLVGTIARARGLKGSDIPQRSEVGAGTLGRDAFAPAELWFMQIRHGDVPALSSVVTMTVGWVREWLEANGHGAPATAPDART